MRALASQSLEVCAPVNKDLLVPQRVISKWGRRVCGVDPPTSVPIAFSWGVVPRDRENRGRNVQRMEVAEEGDSEETVVVSVPQPTSRHQRIFSLSTGPRAPRATLEDLWLHCRGREEGMDTVRLPLCMSAWRLFSSKPVSRAVPLIWDHLQWGGGVNSKGQCSHLWSSGHPAAVEGTGLDRGAAGVWLEGQTEVFWGLCMPTDQI